VVISTLLIAGLFNPLRRQLQRVIDRSFYRPKYDAAQAVEAFSAMAQREVALENLTSGLVEVVGQTVQPQHVSVWMRDR
jgi:hypothetical protein